MGENYRATSASANKEKGETSRPRDQPAADDGPLDSLGKAIAAPVEGAAEPEEPTTDNRRPMSPGP